MTPRLPDTSLGAERGKQCTLEPAVLAQNALKLLVAPSVGGGVLERVTVSHLFLCRLEQLRLRPRIRRHQLTRLSCRNLSCRKSERLRVKASVSCQEPRTAIPAGCKSVQSTCARRRHSPGSWGIACPHDVAPQTLLAVRQCLQSSVGQRSFTKLHFLASAEMAFRCPKTAPHPAGKQGASWGPRQWSERVHIPQQHQPLCDLERPCYQSGSWVRWYRKQGALLNATCTPARQH